MSRYTVHLACLYQRGRHELFKDSREIVAVCTDEESTRAAMRLLSRGEYAHCFFGPTMDSWDVRDLP